MRSENLSREIDELSNAIQMDFNFGAYKYGMAASQADYDESMKRLFGRLDELEERLGRSKYLFGNHITEPDIR
jgi:glutathionyl-hydroquinone reductase